MNIETFKEKHCAFCGTQRCTGEGEWLEVCPHYRIFVKGESTKTKDKIDVSRCVWHSIEEKPKKGVNLIINKNLAYDCSSMLLPAVYDGNNFLFSREKEKDILEWSYAPGTPELESEHCRSFVFTDDAFIGDKIINKKELEKAIWKYGSECFMKGYYFTKL